MERVVALYPGIGLEYLRTTTTNEVSDYSQAEIIRSLYFPKALVCWGIGEDDPGTNEPIESLLERDLSQLEYILPNPMRKRSGRSLKGNKSVRCKETAALPKDRRFTVIECDISRTNKDGSPSIWDGIIDKWQSSGITVKDASVRLLFYLLKEHQAKLSLIVDSAGKSLHAWVNARDIEPDKLRALEREAVKLGADWHAFLPWQWCRFAGGRRSNGKHQEIPFYSPENLPTLETNEAQDLMTQRLESRR